MITWDTVAAALTTGLPLLGAALTFLSKAIKNAKAKRALEQTARLTDVLRTLVVEAETFGRLDGAAKKAFVLDKAAEYAKSARMAFDREAAGQKVEELVALSKQVNARDKDPYPVQKGVI